MEHTIERARTLFQLKEYSKVVTICLEIIEEDTKNAEAWTLAAKSFLFQLPSSTDKELNMTFYKAARNACATASTIEEAKKIEYEIFSAVNEWEIQTRKEALKKLEDTPCLEYLQEYTIQDFGYVEMRLHLQIATRSDCAELGENVLPEKPSKEEANTLLYEAALRVFEETKEKAERDTDVSADAAIALSRVLIKRINAADGMVDYSIPKKGENTEIRHERLKSAARIKTFMLEALIYPNGRPMSLFTVRRDEIHHKIEEIYEELKEADPNFVVPEIPSAELIKLPPAKKSGCYVATAVYGSYDCPQVWTLRRFRDYTLAKTWYGRAFIRTYYAISPTLVSWFGHTDWFKKLWRGRLDKMVTKLNSDGVKDTPYEDKVW